MAVDISQAAVDAVMPEGESSMVDAEEVEKGGVHIVDLGGVFAVQRFVPPWVTFSMGDSAFDSPATEPVGEDIGVVVASFEAVLRGRHSTKLRGPENEGILEETALFEVLDEGGCTARHAHGEGAMVTLDVFMGIPVPSGKTVVVSAPDLDKTHTAFEEAACSEAFLREVEGFFRLVDGGGP